MTLAINATKNSWSTSTFKMAEPKETRRVFSEKDKMIELKKYENYNQTTIFVDRNHDGKFDKNEAISIRFQSLDGTREYKDTNGDSFCDKVIITDTLGNQTEQNIEVDKKSYPNNEDNNLMSWKYDNKTAYHRGRALDNDGNFMYK